VRVMASVFGRPFESTTSPVGGVGQEPAAQGLSTGQKLDIAGGAIGAFGSIMGGINALSSAKANAKLQRQAGREAFQRIMGDTKQAAGTYQAQQGASGLISQSARDVKRAGMSTGIKDAVTAKLNYDIEAVNSMYEGKMARAQGYMGAATSMLGVAKNLSTK
jgi:hypothetical protein